MSALVSLLGMAVLLGIGVLCSSNRRAIRLRTVGGAFALQIALGALVLFYGPGRAALKWLSDVVRQVIAAGDEGIRFLFGPTLMDQNEVGFIFVVRVLPVIIFFSSLIAVLYYLRIMPLVIKLLGGALRKALGTSRAESLSATANIFVGQTEAPLVVRPYIPHMTQSELFAVMVGGLASIAGSVLAAYAGMGVRLEWLLAACFMTAPGGLLFAKLLMPETGRPQEILPKEDVERPVNLLDAAAQGAASGLKLALNVGAMLLAFIALIALANLGIGALGGVFGRPELTLEQVLGAVFAPLAWLLGIPWAEAAQSGSFIGEKIILNEFVAYDSFLKDGSELSELSQGIITFALCGFANLASIAILLGGLGGIAPTRRAEIARFGMKAVLAASLANFMSAAIAGVFLSLAL